MKKSRLSLSVSALIIGAIPMTTLTVSPSAYAASDADCSIWLCLPTGFPSGCGDAKSAFKRRIKKLKPPLPNFSSCLLKNSPSGSSMSYKENVAAKMPDGSYIHGRPCIYKRYNKDNITWTPYKCTGTWYYIDTYMGKQGYGERFYYQR